MVSEAHALVDADNIAMLQEMMGDEFADLIAVFIEDAEMRIAQIKQLSELGEAREVSDLAHGLKGSAMNLSAQRLAYYSRQLEVQCREGQLGQVGRLIEQTEQAYQQFKSYLLSL